VLLNKCVLGGHRQYNVLMLRTRYIRVFGTTTELVLIELRLHLYGASVLERSGVRKGRPKRIHIV
jgi:hypothetical protein